MSQPSLLSFNLLADATAIVTYGRICDFFVTDGFYNTLRDHEGSAVRNVRVNTAKGVLYRHKKDNCQLAVLLPP
jgi:hypothetical protein